MSSLSTKDRASLCSFTFSDGRRCRTPRLGDNPRFSPYHAQKEARAHAAQSLGKDLAYFFSGDYLSACDLSSALGRLIPAVIRGDIKPRSARTLAYLAQTLVQTIHLAQDEYINAFDTDGWRRAIRNSVNTNYDYRFPPAPKPEQPESPQPQPQSAPPSTRPQPVAPPSPVCHPERSEGSLPSPAAQPPTHDAPQSEIATLSGPAHSPHTPLPPTSDEFVQQVAAGSSRPVSPGLTGKTGDSKAPSERQTHSVDGARPTPAPTGNASCAARADASRPASPQPTSTPSRTPNRDACLRFNSKHGINLDGKPV